MTEIPDDADFEGEDPWFYEHFDSRLEAEAFAYGLEWGDEPQWIVREVEVGKDWTVEFAHVEDVPEDEMELLRQAALDHRGQP